MRLDPDVMRAVGAVVRVVVIARIPSDSLRSTWVEPGHARRLGRMESEGTGLFCPFSARPVRCLVMRARFPHGSVVDPCGNRSLLGWLCRTRLGEGQNRPSATIGNVKDSDWGRAQLEMSSPSAFRRQSTCGFLNCLTLNILPPPSRSRTWRPPTHADCCAHLRDVIRKHLSLDAGSSS